MNNPFENFKSSGFVSQYAGIPIDEFQQTESVLQERLDQNRDTMDKLDLLAEQVQVDSSDELVKKQRIDQIREVQNKIAETGAYEMAGSLVRKEAMDFSRDKRLNTAQSNYKQIQEDREKASTLSPTQQAMYKLKLQQYREKGVGDEPDEFGNYNSFGNTPFYEEQSIDKLLNEFVQGWKEHGYGYSELVEGGYIRDVDSKFITEEEVRDAAFRMLSNDPKISHQIEMEARYKNYMNTNDLSYMDKDSSAMTYGKVKYKDPDTGKYKERDITAREAVMSSYVEPYVDKTAFEDIRTKMKSDSTYGVKYEMSKLADIGTYSGPDVNFGDVPDSKTYKQNIEEKNQEINRYQSIINDKNVNEDRKVEAREKIASLKTELSRLRSVESQFIEERLQQSQLDEASKDILREMNLNDLVFERYSQSFNSVSNTEYGNIGLETVQDKQKSYFITRYKEKYGSDPTQEQISNFQSEVGKARRDVDSYIDKVSREATQTPVVYQFSNKMREDGLLTNLENSITSGNINVYSSDNGLDRDAQLRIKSFDVQVDGPTSRQGVYAVKIKELTRNEIEELDEKEKEWYDKNKNKLLYVEPLGAGNSSINNLTNGLMQQAARAYKTSGEFFNQAGMDYAQEFLNNSRGLANPDYLQHQLDVAATSGLTTDIFHPDETDKIMSIEVGEVEGERMFSVVAFENGVETGKSKYTSKENAQLIINEVKRLFDENKAKIGKEKQSQASNQ